MQDKSIFIKVYAQNKSDIHDLTAIKKKLKNVTFVHLPVKKKVITLRRNYHGEGYAWYDKYNYSLHRALIIIPPFLIGSFLKYVRDKNIFLDILHK